MNYNFRINLYTKCIMKVNNIILSILIKIAVTLFNYSLYYKIEAKCCPNFP